MKIPGKLDIGTDPIGINIVIVRYICKKLCKHDYKSFKEILSNPPKLVFFNWFNYESLKGAIRFFSKVIIYKLLGIKIVWMVHNIIPHVIYNYKMMYLQRKLFSRFVDRFIFFNYNNMRVFEKYFKMKVAHKSSIVLHPPFPIEIPPLSKEEARQKMGLPLDKKIILHFGAIMDYKGVIELIDVIKKLQEDEPNPPLFVLLGRPKKDISKEELESALKQLKDYIWVNRFLPETDLSAYLLSADVIPMNFKIIFNSSTFPLAKRFPARIIVPKMSGLLEQDKYGYPSIFFKPNDPDALYSALKEGLESPPNPYKIIDDSLVEKSWDLFIDEIRQIFFSVIHPNQLPHKLYYSDHKELCKMINKELL
ncbi:MAG: glycosyltransferase [Promethearchaeota archaeon]